MTAATYPAASCNESDVQAAYNTEQASAADGDIISIPAGTCTWTVALTISPANSLTFQGAGAVSATSGGASVTGSDQTIINTDVDPWFTITTAANKTYRITGLALNEKAGYPSGSDGSLAIYGSSTAVRVDHNHFSAYVTGYRMFTVYGSVQGVADHNAIDSYVGVTNWLAIENGRTWNGNADNGNSSWADYSYWGSSKFFFGEDNHYDNHSINGGYINDCSTGGRQVWRHNTIIGHPAIQQHEALQDDRGCRGGEMYQNTFAPYDSWQSSTAYLSGEVVLDPSSHMQQASGNCTSGSTTPAWNDSGGTTSDGTCKWSDQGGYSVDAVVGPRSGTVLVWGNTLQSAKQVVSLYIDRVTGVNGTFVPQKPAMCGNGDVRNGFVGTVNTNGTAVTLTAGNNTFGANIQFAYTSPAAWPFADANPYIYINGVQYTVSTVNSATSLTLTTSAGSQTGVAYYVPSVWDGNADTSGYPCYDMPGRGKGDLITGSFVTANRVNSATGTPVWPREVVDPVYAWGNTVSWVYDISNDVVSGIGIDVFHDGRDFYIDGFTPSSLTQTSSTSPFNGSNTTEAVSSWSLGSNVLTLTVPATSGFTTGQTVNVVSLATGTNQRVVDGTYTISSLTGTTVSLTYTPGSYSDSGGAGGWVSSIGVGQGTFANRPSTCTAGTDPAQGNIAAPGVAYWATDQSTLYVCNPTNTWTAYYTPYTYPHPLTQGTQPPNPPTNLTGTAH
jgi:hypothetical protein